MAMTIEEIKAAKAETEREVGRLLSGLEERTGCRVESVYYRPIATYGSVTGYPFVELEMRLG